MFTTEEKRNFIPKLNGVAWERSADGGIVGHIHVEDKVNIFALKMTVGFGANCVVESVKAGLCKLMFNQAQILQLQALGLKNIPEIAAAQEKPQTPVARTTPGKGAAKPTR